MIRPQHIAALVLGAACASGSTGGKRDGSAPVPTAESGGGGVGALAGAAGAAGGMAAPRMGGDGGGAGAGDRPLPGVRDAAEPAALNRDATGPLKVTDGVMDEGQLCLVIETPTATYYYQKVAAGFSSILDRQGNDWIGFHPSGGFVGSYRGVPNLGPCCHPGYPSGGGVPMTTTLVEARPERVRINSVSKDGGWDVTWDFFSDHATMTVNKAKGNYWMLYEATPGGSLGAEDFWVQASGKRMSIDERWNGDLPGPEWVYFADGKLQRSFFLAHHEDDRFPEEYWNGGAMTVWGFARAGGAPSFAPGAPQHLSIGLVDGTLHDVVTRVVEAALRAP